MKEWNCCSCHKQSSEKDVFRAKCFGLNYVVSTYQRQCYNYCSFNFSGIARIGTDKPQSQSIRFSALPTVITASFLFFTLMEVIWSIKATSRFMLPPINLPSLDMPLAICDRAYKNRPCERKPHQIIFSSISFIPNALSLFRKLQKKAH